MQESQFGRMLLSTVDSGGPESTMASGIDYRLALGRAYVREHFPVSIM